MSIKAVLLVFIVSLAVCTAFDPEYFLEVNLLEKVNTTTSPTRTGGHAYGRQDIRKSVSISWLDIPPYIYDEGGPETEHITEKSSKRAEGVANKSDEEKRGLKSENVNVKGIFYEIVNKGLQICHVIPPKAINYTTKAKDLQHLDQTIARKNADIAMPVYGSEDDKYGGYEYVEILKSPGVVFIVNKHQTLEHSRNRVLHAMQDTWPVIVITLLLTGFAGFLVWGLDTSGNPDHFPRSFARGVMEGIWWSFVSMTTVGYGDRIPKSLFARLFGIIWILTGLVLCSYFTATFTSALTSSSIKQHQSLLGVKVAVIADSHAYDEALKHAANVKDYPDFYKMYDALVEKREVDGILADIYTASHYMDNISDPRLAVSMFFSSQRSIGFVTGGSFELNVECLRNLFKYRQRDIKKIILKHIQAFHTETRNRRLTDDADTDDMMTLLDGDSRWFKNAFHALLITFVLMLTIGFAYDSCIARLRTQRLTAPKEYIVDSIKMAATLATCKPNR